MAPRYRSYFLLFLLYFCVSFAMAIEIDDADRNKSLQSKKIVYWPRGEFAWYYSKDQEPSWVDTEGGIKLFKHAAETWAGCGLNITFKGLIDSPIKQQDGLNVLGWQKLAPPIRGLTLRQTKYQSEELLEADITLNIVNKDIQKDPLLLQKVADHEFGHALGLIHSEGCSDIMSSAFECGARIANPLPTSVTEKDMAQCRLRYPPKKDFK
jgi:hypothetical protein